MCEDFATCLANEFAISLLLNNFRFRHLSLFVGLLDIPPDLASLDYVLAGGRVGPSHRGV